MYDHSRREKCLPTKQSPRSLSLKRNRGGTFIPATGGGVKVHHEGGLWITTCPTCTWTTWHHTPAAACDTARTHQCGHTFGPSPTRPNVEITWTAGGDTITETNCDFYAVDAWI